MSNNTTRDADEIERLRKIYGDLTIVPERNAPPATTRLWVGAMVVALVLAVALSSAATWLMYLSDEKQKKAATPKLTEEVRQAEVEDRRVAAEFQTALVAQFHANRVVGEKIKVADDAEARPDVAPLRNARRELVIASREQQAQAAKLAALRNLVLEKSTRAAKAAADLESSRPAEPSNPIWPGSSSLSRFLSQATRLLGHLFLTVCIVAFLAIFAIAWARRRVSSMVERFFDTISSPQVPAATSSVPPLTVFGMPMRSAWANSAMPVGDFTVRAAVAAGAAVVTIGAFAIMIPGKAIGLTPEESVGRSTLTVGDLAIEVPGRKIEIEPEVNYPAASFEVPGIELNLPAVQQPAPSDEFARELSAYRTFLERQAILETGLRAASAENAALRAEREQLRVALSERPTRDDFEVLREDFGKFTDEQKKTIPVVTAALDGLSAKAVDDNRIAAMEITRAINVQNDQTATAVFRQTIMDENCDRYNKLAKMYPDVIQWGGCIAKTRLLRPRPSAPERPPEITTASK